MASSTPLLNHDAPHGPWKGQAHKPRSPTDKIPTRVCCVVDDPRLDEQPQDSDHFVDPQEEIIYQDKYVAMSTSVLTLKTYYFPSGTQKRIFLKDVTALAVIDSTEAPQWGTNEGTTWWTYDHLRGRRPVSTSASVTADSELFTMAFTIRRPDDFWKAAKTLFNDKCIRSECKE